MPVCVYRILHDSWVKKKKKKKNSSFFACVERFHVTLYSLNSHIWRRSVLDNVRMAEWSKALRSGRSLVLQAWVRIPLLTIFFSSHLYPVSPQWIPVYLFLFCLSFFAMAQIWFIQLWHNSWGHVDQSPNREEEERRKLDTKRFSTCLSPSSE